jgi:hypothetical protein
LLLDRFAHDSRAESNESRKRKCSSWAGIVQLYDVQVVVVLFAGQSVGVTFDGIYTQLAKRIASKDALLPTYRTNLPNVPIWLLLYSCWEVARSVPMPSGIREWTYPFGFDRVFFFAASSQCVEEIHPA